MANLKPNEASSEQMSTTPNFDGIDVAECFKQAFCLNILVCGRTGVGKSSLINNLVGSQVCEVNDPGCEGGNFDRGTTEVNETKVNIDNVFVTIYDSPGLQDGTDDEEKYLQDMHNKCKDVNLVLYCMEMTSPRYTSAEIRATELITNKFGPDFWNRCVLVMTKANMVRVPPSEKGKERDYHMRLYDKFMDKFRDQLIKQGVSKDVANAIPGVATGNVHPDDDEERYIWYPSTKAEPSERPVDFLSELWVTCFERTASDSQAKFLRATTRQRVKPLPAASEAEQKLKKQIEEAKKREEELKRNHNEEYKEKERQFTKKLEQTKQEYQSPPLYQPPSVVNTGYTSSTRSSPNTGRAAAGAVTGAAAGAMVAGPVGAVVGAVFGFLFGK